MKLLLINILTLIRIVGTIILIPIYKKYGGLVAGIFSLICYATDSIDGFLARHFKSSTFFGALFDGVADKLFTIINFVLLYLITPYALIPIVFELLITVLQFIKFNNNYNIKSNIIGKAKVWFLAISVVLTFIVSDINNVTFLSTNFRNHIALMEANKLYFYLLFPTILMEFLTFISYFLEIFKKNNKIKKEIKKDILIPKSYNKWEKIKYVWLNPDFYKEHKSDANLKDIWKLSRV